MGLHVTLPPQVARIVEQCFKMDHKERPTMDVVLQELSAGERFDDVPSTHVSACDLTTDKSSSVKR